MDNSIFTPYQSTKAKIIEAAKTAFDAQIIDGPTFDAIIKKVDNDTLTIGVIGQMKCGKSTFLNAMLFGDQFLPAATTPMTAALTTITYGKEMGLKAEFYTFDEWQQIIHAASITDPDAFSPKVKAAKHLLEKSAAIGAEISTLLGTVRTASIDHLTDYVGADGRYVAITKSVTITMPMVWLKGVQIVDTPGFNDPVASREQRTNDFLAHADAVLMMLYAGRPFDSTDREILFDKLRRVGIDKVVLAVNKYDLQIAQGESPEQIKSIVINELRKAAEQLDIAIDTDELHPILVSALMALLARMSMREITLDANLYHHYKKYCQEFEIDSQEQLLYLSNIAELEKRFSEVISTQKDHILFHRPLALIRSKAESLIDSLRQELLTLNRLSDELSIPDEALEQRLANLIRAQRRIERTVSSAESDLADTFDEISSKLFREVQDMADNAKWECEHLIETYKKATLERKLAERIDRFRNREFPRMVEDISRKLKRALDYNINLLIDDIEQILSKHVEDAEDITAHFKRTLRRSLEIEQTSYFIKTTDIREVEPSDDEEEPTFLWWQIAQLVAMIPMYPINGIMEFLDSGRDEARQKIDELFASIDWDGMHQMMHRLKHQFIASLGGDTVKTLISNLVEQMQQVQSSQTAKAVRLTTTQSRIIEITNRLSTIETTLWSIAKLAM